MALIIYCLFTDKNDRQTNTDTHMNMTDEV